MTVRIAHTAGDGGEGRRNSLQKLARTGGSAAVMADLEEVRRKIEIGSLCELGFLQLLRISRQQKRTLTETEAQHEGIVVRVATRSKPWAGTQHVQVSSAKPASTAQFVRTQDRYAS
jgi:hypothetical protein